jgi:glucose-1-phosphate thymidylyltransferase
MGGYAKRLEPISRNIPKGLLPLPQGCILENIINILKTNSFIDKVYLSTNQKYSGILGSFLKRKSWDVDLIIEKTTSDRDKLGSIGGLMYALDRIGDLGDGILVIAGDNFFIDNLVELCRMYMDNPKNMIAIYDVGLLDRAKRYGVVRISKGKVIDLSEKPEQPQSTLISIGVYIFPTIIREVLDEYAETIGKMDRMGDFISWLVSEHDVYGYFLKGCWYDIGNKDEYLQLISSEFPGIHIADRAKILGSKFLGNVLIMNNAVIYNSLIKNSVVLSDVYIKDSYVENSIVGFRKEINKEDIKDMIV